MRPHQNVVWAFRKAVDPEHRNTGPQQLQIGFLNIFSVCQRKLDLVTRHLGISTL
jgi:hypothetical protein